MRETTIEVTTPRGTMPVHIRRSDGGGPRVILYMDAPGIRPALFGYAERLAGAGYTAILPDLYYALDPADRPNIERIEAGVPEEFERMHKAVAQVRDDDSPRGHAPDARGGPGDCRRLGVHRLLHGRPHRDAGRRGVRNRYRGGLAAAPHESGHRPARLPASRARSSRRIAVPRIWRERQRHPALDDPAAPREARAGRRRLSDRDPAGAEHGFTMPGRAAYNETAAEQVWAGTLSLLHERLQ